YGGIVREFSLDSEDTQVRPADSVRKWISEESALANAELPSETPYVVQAAYELKRTDSEYVLERDLNGEDVTQYIYGNMRDKYDQAGLLALSAEGDFVLLRRSQRAILQSKQNESYPANRAAWPLNGSQARLPNPDEQTEVTSCRNPKVQSNENQRRSVQK